MFTKLCSLLTEGAATVTVGLVANKVVVSLMYSRTSYWPNVIGNVNGTLALVRPETGAVCEPFRYFRARYAEAFAPTGNRPSQSVGFPGAVVIEAVTVPPPFDEVGETFTVAVLATVMVGLVASNVLSPANSRTL